MRSKPLVILLVLAVALVVLASMTGKSRQTAAPTDIGKLLLPDLPVNDIARVTLVNQGDTVTVARAEGAWTVVEKHNYPANFDRVRTALVKLSELKIGDRRQATADSRATYGVVEPSPEHPDATRIELANASGKSVASILLGKHHLRKAPEGAGMGGDYPDGRYVSTDGGKTIYLVRDPLTDFTAQGMAWMVSELLNVDAAEIERITITGPDREPLELSKFGTEGALQVSNLAATEEADAANLSSLRNALAYLNLQDVAAPLQTDAAMAFDAPLSFTAEARDGRSYKLLVGGPAAENGRYVRMHAEFREPTPPAPIVDAAGVTNTPPAPDTSAARAAVDALNQKLANWTYVIPSYKADALVMTRAQLAKPKPAATPEPEGQVEVPEGAPAITVEPSAQESEGTPPEAAPAPTPPTITETNRAIDEPTGAATP